MPLSHTSRRVIAAATSKRPRLPRQLARQGQSLISSPRSMRSRLPADGRRARPSGAARTSLLHITPPSLSPSPMPIFPQDDAADMIAFLAPHISFTAIGRDDCAPRARARLRARGALRPLAARDAYAGARRESLAAAAILLPCRRAFAATTPSFLARARS